MIYLESRRILVPTDFTLVSKRALAPASELARRSSGEVMLLHVRRSSADRERCMAEANALADEIREKYAVRVTVFITDGRRATEIVKAAERYEADLIVMGTDGEASESSIFFGSNAYRVVKKSRVPVLTVRREQQAPLFSKILLPVDLSIHSRQKVNLAIRLAASHNAALHVLGILSRSETDRSARLDVIMRQIRNFAIERVADYGSSVVISDNAAKRTIAVARREHADLIVAMTDEHEGNSRQNYLSFDDQLVNESPIPVLSVQPELHEEDIELATIAGLG